MLAQSLLFISSNTGGAMRKLLIVVAMIFVTSSAAGEITVMKNQVKSQTKFITPSSYTLKDLKIDFPAGNIEVTENGPLSIEYFFVFNNEKHNKIDANDVFAQCKVQLEKDMLTVEYPKMKDMQINAYFKITLPKGLSLAVNMRSGNIKLKDVTVGSAVVKMNTGNITLDQPVFGSNADVVLNTGNLEYKFDKTSTGTIVYEGKFPKINISDGCTQKENSIICNAKLPVVNVALKDAGNLAITQLK